MNGVTIDVIVQPVLVIRVCMDSGGKFVTIAALSTVTVDIVIRRPVNAINVFRGIGEPTAPNIVIIIVSVINLVDIVRNVKLVNGEYTVKTCVIQIVRHVIF